MTKISAGGLTAHVEKVARHRNGVSGEAFYVVLFREGGRNFVGTIFEGSVPADEGDEPKEPCDPRVALLDRDLLAQGVIEMGENSWRGDQYEPLLRAAVRQWREAR